MAKINIINAKRKYEGAIHAAIYCRISTAHKAQLNSLTSQISRLTNMKYTGTAIISVNEDQYKITDHHPTIISSDAFDAVQTERDLRSIRTIRETHDYEKDRIRLLNKLEKYKLQNIKADRLGILPKTKD